MRRFEEVYEQHGGRVFAFFAYRLESRETAEDLTQQTFERALRAWSRFDPRRAGVATWLLSIARNLLIDHLRVASHEGTGYEPGEDQRSEDPDPRLGPEPDLAAALAQLSDRERELLALRYGGDLSGPEIAELTGLTLANVQQILSRSLRRLRADLEAAQAASGPKPPALDAAKAIKSRPEQP